MSLLALSIQRPMEKKGGYSYPVPKNPLTLPPRIKTTTKPPTKELPPCPLDCNEDVINIRAMEIPGQTCRELEPCPDNPDNVKDVPGKTCQVPCPSEDPGYNYPTPENPLTLPPQTITTPIPPTLPPCPLNCDTDNVKISEGQNCQEIPLCPEELTPDDVPGTTCHINACPDGYNYVTPETPFTLPPKTSTTPTTATSTSTTTTTSTTPTTTTSASELPPCPKLCNDDVDIRTVEIPGVDCKELPDCPASPAEYDSLEPGVTCNLPCPDNEGYEYSTPQNPLTLPPKVSTTPSTPTTTQEGYNYPTPENPLNLPRQPNELVDVPEYFGEDFEIDINELPDFDPEDFFSLEESERKGDNLTPLTTPSTPPLLFQRVPILEPVLIKSCSEMKDKIPGVNCLDETEIITSPLDLQKLDSEDLKPCLDVTADGTIEPMPGVNCLLEPVLLLIPQDNNDGISRPILGLDFNLASNIFAPKKK